MMVLATCPVCGNEPELIMCHALWNVKCQTPDCVGYPQSEFLSRDTTSPENPFDVAARRWNAWAEAA